MVELKSIHEALRAWGAWRARGARPGVMRYSSAAITGPDWETRRKACPHCCGRGYTVTIDDGADRCGYCLGDGEFTERVPLIDPATISGRSVMGVDLDTTPAIYRTIDGAVESFDVRRRTVVLVRYAFAPHALRPTRLLYANRIFRETGNKPISGVYFGELLTDVKRRLAELTGLPFKGVAK